ncbi:histone-lysine N-methyltransferase SETMAR-like [Pogonomyrmex barbatus]|uniref:Histone-lysine N-methyltransferase SETMAR-like n=1 Tax=Pogonomyrmex barbatus TaxID=144034 RepID=A0A6I9WU34_9HYME|nr:histone-lysine N-methyltransferase SETMAR-like [Pogonomyrmex barbatus]
MEKIEYRAVIKFLHLKGNTPTQIKAELDAIYEDSAPSFATVKRWAAEFKRGRTSLADDERSGRPTTATIADNIERIHQMILDDRRIKVREIAEAVGISKERVCHILTKELNICKLNACWVPRLLTVDQKRIRMNISKTLLERFKRNESDFLSRLITVDETWIHYFTSGTKEQSNRWTAKDEPALKKTNIISSAEKVIATFFWDSHGIVFIDYLEKGKTITGVYYASLIDKLKTEIAKKRPHLKKKKVLFHQDNTPAHTSVVAMAKIHELQFELIDHPPYSPDLAPSNFFLFPRLKVWLRKQKFSSNKEIIAFVEAYFAKQDANYYLNGLKEWKHRWKKCIDLKGDYVEK